jgi:hypothetical protein
MDLRIALSPVVNELPEHTPCVQTEPPATVHVTFAGTTIAAHRSATATMTTEETAQCSLNHCLTG